MSEDPLEINNSDAIGQLNSVRYVDLREISEPNKRAFNSLRIVVEGAVVSEASVAVSDRPEIANLLAGAHPIESVVGSNAPNGYTDEVYWGKILRVYTGSRFLDHVMRDTGGHTQEVLHYKLICLNHFIDVISSYPPEVGSPCTR
jgi:hypothetical protein